MIFDKHRLFYCRLLKQREEYYEDINKLNVPKQIQGIDFSDHVSVTLEIYISYN